MPDPFIEFVALVAHATPPSGEPGATLIGCLIVSPAGMGICSPPLQSSSRHHERRGLFVWWSLNLPHGKVYPVRLPDPALALRRIRRLGRVQPRPWLHGVELTARREPAGFLRGPTFAAGRLLP